jgi:hypothetical protein
MMTNQKYSYSAQLILLQKSTLLELIPAAAWSKGWVCSRSIAGIADSNHAWGIDVYLL